MMDMKLKVEMDDAMEVDESAEKDISDLRRKIEDLEAEKERLLDYQNVLTNNRDMYKENCEKANYDLATAEDKIQDLEDGMERKRGIIDKRNQEITNALEQKNYNATRVVQMTAANKEKDARIADLKEQLRNMGNKVARREEDSGDDGSAPSSLRGDEHVGPLGLHRIDMRAMKEQLDLTMAENELLKKENQETAAVLKDKKEVIARMQRVYDRVYEEQQQRIRDSRYPEEICVTSVGAKYHLSFCKHLQRAGKDLPCVKYKRCFDCG
jgi:chromosome segregation ATPase